MATLAPCLRLPSAFSENAKLGPKRPDLGVHADFRALCERDFALFTRTAIVRSSIGRFSVFALPSVSSRSE